MKITNNKASQGTCLKYYIKKGATVTWAKVTDPRNGESYFASPMESKDRARKRQIPTIKNNRGENKY